MLYIDGQGQEFSSIAKMCRHWGIDPIIFNKRMQAGWGLKKSLETPKEVEVVQEITKNRIYKKSIDHLGNEFDSFTEMCKHYNISDDTVRYRLNKGESLEHALTNRIDKSIDHLGNEFDSFNSMCRHYNILNSTVRSRLNKGKTLEYALTTNTDKSTTTGVAVFGVKQRTVREACEYHSVKYNSVYRRVKEWGISVEESIESFVLERVQNAAEIHNRSLTEQKKKDTIKTNTSNESIINDTVKTVKDENRVKDHLGNEFTSFAEMCRHYGKSEKIVNMRLNLRWSLESALTRATQKQIKRGIEKELRENGISILGIRYKNINQASKDCGICITTVNNYANKLKISQEKALELLAGAEKNRDKSKQIEILGKYYNSVDEACQKLGMKKEYVIEVKKYLNCTTVEAIKRILLESAQ